MCFKWKRPIPRDRCPICGEPGFSWYPAPRSTGLARLDCICRSCYEEALRQERRLSAPEDEILAADEIPGTYDYDFRDMWW